MTRDDVIVLLTGIFHFCEDHWMLVDESDEEIAQGYQDLKRFDKDKEISYGVYEYLLDNRDCMEEISWSVDIVLKYFQENVNT